MSPLSVDKLEAQAPQGAAEAGGAVSGGVGHGVMSVPLAGFCHKPEPIMHGAPRVAVIHQRAITPCQPCDNLDPRRLQRGV